MVNYLVVFQTRHFDSFAQCSVYMYVVRVTCKRLCQANAYYVSHFPGILMPVPVSCVRDKHKHVMVECLK